MESNWYVDFVTQNDSFLEVESIDMNYRDIEDSIIQRYVSLREEDDGD